MKKNIIANIIGRFWGVLSNFLFIPLYIKYLGFEAYSLIGFSLVITAMMAVLDAGLSATLSREFSRSDNSISNKIKIFRTLETTYFIIVTACIVLVFSLSDFIAHNAVNLATFTYENVSYYIKIISVDIGFQLLIRYYLGGLLGLERQVKANIYQVGWGITRNGLVILGIMFQPSLETFFLWQAFSTVIFTLLFRMSLNQELTGKFSIDIKLKIEKAVFKSNWRFAGGMLLISMVAALNTQMDKMAITKFLPVESLGYYTLGVSLATGILVVVNPISIALLPRFTALYSSNNILDARKLFEKVYLYVVLIVFSISVNMSFFSEKLIWIWTGNQELALKAHIFLPFLSITYAMMSIATIPYNVVIANGYTKLNNLLGLISLGITLPGYWFATKSYGAVGAAIVFCIVQTFTTLIFTYFINKKYMGLSNNTIFVKQMLFPILLTLGISYIFSFMPLYIESSRFLSLIWIMISTSFTLLFSGLILIAKSEKLLLKEMIFNIKTNI